MTLLARPERFDLPGAGLRLAADRWGPRTDDVATLPRADFGDQCNDFAGAKINDADSAPHLKFSLSWAFTS